MGAGIYTYRIKDGQFHNPPFPCTIFIVTKPNGEDIESPWESCEKARAFCHHRNKEIRIEQAA